jgi:hypothetical protein
LFEIKPPALRLLLDKAGVCPHAELSQNHGLNMETNPPGPDATEPNPPRITLWSRLLNIFAAPGEVFEEVKAGKPSVANWLVPVLLLAVAGMFSSLVIFSQPEIVQTIHEQQQKAFDKQVAAGKLTQVQADQAATMAEKFSGPTMMKVYGCMGAAVGSFLSLFWWAFLLWLIARLFLKVPLDYMKVLEIAGLAAMIAVLAAVVKTLLVVVTGNLYAAPSLVLLVKHFEPRNPVHNLLALFNVMTFWLLAVRSIGLAKLTGAKVVKTAVAVFGIWIVITGLTVGFSLAMQAVFAK